MNWISVTTGSILTNLTQAEYSKYSSISTSSLYTSSSLVQEIINDVTAEVRSYIMGCPRNRVSDDVSLLPASCISKAKQIIIYILMSRVVGKISDVNGSRKDEFDKAYEFLTLISEGKIGVDLPNLPVETAQYNQFFGTSATPILY